MIRNNALYHGDCLEIMSGLECNSVDAVIVDPPYFDIVKDSFDHQWNDEVEYLDWLCRTVTQAIKVLKDGGSFILFCSRQMVHKISVMCESLGLVEQRMIIWCRKRCFNQTRGKALNSGYEPILYFTKGSEKVTFNNIKIKVDSKRTEYNIGTLKDGVSLSDCWTDIPALPHNSKEKVDHPTQKPIKLMERIISIVTNPDDIVLDYCCGSGSTCVACINLGRCFIGIEKDAKFFEIAKQRIESNKVQLNLFSSI